MLLNPAQREIRDEIWRMLEPSLFTRSNQMLTEAACRRPDFQADANPVELANGETWHLPKPSVSLRPQFSGGVSAGLSPRTTFGREFDGQLATIDRRAGDDDYPTEAYINDCLNLGANLLLRNYDLSDDQLSELLAWRGTESAPLLTAILRTARGLGAPKPSPGGSV